MVDQDGVFRKWSIRYLIEYLAALSVYIAACSICIPRARAVSSPITRISLMAVPTAATVVMAFVVYRHFLRIDEFLRRRMLESLAIAGAFTLAWTLVYGLCESAGFPKISIWWPFGGTVLACNLYWVFRKLRP